MKKSITYKIIEENLVEGNICPGEDITIKVQQTLTQDSTGTMVYLALEAMDPEKLATEKSVAYIDHNTLQTGFENADDHVFIRHACEKYGVTYSKPGNGICHQLHLENFGAPGKILIGSDSHTPTCGGLGSLAIGAGGLDVAIGMARGIYSLKMPKVLNVRLTGKLTTGVTAKDIILSLLKELSVKGGTGYIIEYSGEGLEALTVTDRATITNMGAELGATTSIFPSDAQTLKYLTQNNRPEDFRYLEADLGAVYDHQVTIALEDIVPQIAFPHSPDNVCGIEEAKGIKLNQVAIGSCTNSSYKDLVTVANILKGKQVHPNLSLVISPGSSTILKQLSKEGHLNSFIEAGARILENSCGPCIGMGQAPQTDGVSLRTFNRNFKGRCGTISGQVYICSPAVAAISAIEGVITDPRTLDESYFDIKEPETLDNNKAYFIDYSGDRNHVIKKGPNIQGFPLAEPLDTEVSGEVLLKLGDNISTDDIVPSDAKLLPLRSNIPELSKYCFSRVSDDFYEKISLKKKGIVIGGENYGQGSSREHAALAPMYLGVQAVLTKSFARIHRGNLINYGIVPLIIEETRDYNSIDASDELVISQLWDGLASGKIKVYNKSKDAWFTAVSDLSDKELKLLTAGGKLNYYQNN
jgi:aconitate hydratase